MLSVSKLILFNIQQQSQIIHTDFTLLSLINSLSIDNMVLEFVLNCYELKLRSCCQLRRGKFQRGDSMLPIERQHKIKELLNDSHNMKISELSKELGVSEMTIHRDLKPLIEEGLAIKTFGGVTLASADTRDSSPLEGCVICSRSINERLAYRLILTNNRIEMTCCAHCGLLRHHQLGDKVIQAICPDFLRQTTISTPLAWYVMDTSIDMGCCQPQILPFEWKKHANQFVKGFGGNVYRFSEAQEVILQKMNGSDQCSHHQE